MMDVTALSLFCLKEGHTKYLKKADGICPFCHNPLDHQHFEQELKACFDEEYQDSVNAVAAIFRVQILLFIRKSWSV